MGRDDLSTGGAETMNAASTQPRSFDVLCAGLAVGNVVVRPVPEHFSGGDTVQVQEISMMGGGDAFNQACVLAALGEKPENIHHMSILQELKMKSWMPLIIQESDRVVWAVRQQHLQLISRLMQHISQVCRLQSICAVMSIVTRQLCCRNINNMEEMIE